MAENNDSKNSEDSFEIESIGPSDGVEGTADLDDQIKKLSEDLERCKNDYLYLRADFDNYRKGVIKERADLVKYGSERIFIELLEVIDNFERALAIEVTPETVDTYKEGVALTANELKKILNRFGVSEVECEGAVFDPTLHEALSSEETQAVPPGHIARVFKKAYKLHDRVLRPAQVVVAKEPKATES